MFAECSMDRIDQWVSAASKVFLSPRAHTFRNGMDSGVDHGLLGLRKDENFSRETAAQTFRQSFTPNRLGRRLDVVYIESDARVSLGKNFHGRNLTRDVTETFGYVAMFSCSPAKT